VVKASIMSAAMAMVANITAEMRGAKLQPYHLRQMAKDLVAGSGLAFDDRGKRALKSVPGRWRLYAARGRRW
jgi:hypothetical protein